MLHIKNLSEDWTSINIVCSKRQDWHMHSENTQLIWQLKLNYYCDNESKKKIMFCLHIGSLWYIFHHVLQMAKAKLTLSQRRNRPWILQRIAACSDCLPVESEPTHNSPQKHWICLGNKASWQREKKMFPDDIFSPVYWGGFFVCLVVVFFCLEFFAFFFPW